jgi:hypothetical protein
MRGACGRPGTPYSVQMARFYVRAALDYHDPDDYAEDVEMVTSEHVSNAVTQTGDATARPRTATHVGRSRVAVVVTDPCRFGRHGRPDQRR